MRPTFVSGRRRLAAPSYASLLLQEFRGEGFARFSSWWRVFLSLQKGGANALAGFIEPLRFVGGQDEGSAALAHGQRQYDRQRKRQQQRRRRAAVPAPEAQQLGRIPGEFD